MKYHSVIALQPFFLYQKVSDTFALQTCHYIVSEIKKRLLAKEKVKVPLHCVTCRAKFVKLILGYSFPETKYCFNKREGKGRRLIATPTVQQDTERARTAYSFSSFGAFET